jgi:hypothetical protein
MLLQFNNYVPTQGIGYHAYRNSIMFHENKTSTQLEKEEYERYTVYFGRMHLTDFSTKLHAIGPLKIGQSKWPTSILRGRNEGGGQFRVYGEIVFYHKHQMKESEILIHDLFKSRSIKGEEGQKELFNILDSEIDAAINDSIAMLVSPRSVVSKGVDIKFAMRYDNDLGTPVTVPATILPVSSFLEFADV